MCDGTVHFVGGKKGKIENLWNGNAWKCTMCNKRSKDGKYSVASGTSPIFFENCTNFDGIPKIQNVHLDHL